MAGWLLAVQGTLNSFLQHHSSKASILQLSTFFPFGVGSLSCWKELSPIPKKSTINQLAVTGASRGEPGAMLEAPDWELGVPFPVHLRPLRVRWCASSFVSGPSAPTWPSHQSGGSRGQHGWNLWGLQKCCRNQFLRNQALTKSLAVSL